MLEAEYDELYEKYQRALAQDLPVATPMQPTDKGDDQVKLAQYEVKIKVLEEQQDELTRTYGLQFAKMKTQMTE